MVVLNFSSTRIEWLRFNANMQVSILKFGFLSVLVFLGIIAMQWECTIFIVIVLEVFNFFTE